MGQPLISAATLSRLAAIDERAMPSSCRVLRRTPTTSGGRTTYGPETEVAEVACRLMTASSPREAEAIGRLAEDASAMVSLLLGTDVTGEDRIEVTTGASVQTFEVVGDPWPASYSTSLSVAVKREG